MVTCVNTRLTVLKEAMITHDANAILMIRSIALH